MQYSAAQPALRPVLLFASVGLIIAVALSSSFSGMYELWQRSAHQHGLVVLPVTVWLLWRTSRAAPLPPIRPSILLLLVLVPILGLWLAGRLAAIQAVEHLAALLAIVVAFAAVVGPAVTWRLRFGLAFLLLALPVSDLLVPFMMRITADIAELLLQLTGVTYLRQGQYIDLAGGSFVVAEVCSGVRYLTAGMLTLLLFAHVSFASFWRQAAVVGCGAVLLVIANGLRAYLTMIVASATQMRWLGGSDHVYFGWVMFGVVIFLMLWLAGRFADGEAPPAGAPTPTSSSVQAAVPWRLVAVLAAAMLIVTLNPLQSGLLQTVKLALAGVLAAVVVVVTRRTPTDTSGKPATSLGIGGGTVAMLLAVAVIPAAIGWWSAYVQSNEAIVAAAPQVRLDDCRTDGPWTAPWRPSAPGANIVETAFDCGNERLSVVVSWYESASRGPELVSSSNRPWPTNVRRRSDEQSISGRSINAASVDDASTEWLTWYWYEVDNKRIAAPVAAKLAQLRALLSRRPAGGRLVVVAAPLGGRDRAIAKASLDRLVSAIEVVSP
ncbi:MAG: exosortase A [Pseudomonadota bacterium]